MSLRLLVQERLDRSPARRCQRPIPTGRSALPVCARSWLTRRAPIRGRWDEPLPTRVLALLRSPLVQRGARTITICAHTVAPRRSKLDGALQDGIEGDEIEGGQG
ncbi:hypothetical protein B0H14DRAFT_3498691 [Mycena olivaceomarginata]|nr:hypothetical protein B0H14DRAFT_3498691 [Mycena olivaceomarginata]